MGTLCPCKEESKNWDDTQNLYIEGDNLEVLKLLQKSYHGKIKMIYIDPPYNTGSDFVYPDDFSDSLENYKEITGQVDAEGRKVSTNSEANGRYHTDWLNMMYPRLRLARNLLTDDGVIFISIDDNEQGNLKKVCDEIFGETNFITSFIWAAGRKNDSKFASISHEYMLCYVKSLENLKANGVVWLEKKQGLDDIYTEFESLKSKYGSDYSKIQNDLRGWFKSLPDNHPAKNHSHYSCVDEKGIYFAADISWPGGGGPKYEVLHPITKKPVKIPNRGWVYTTPERMQEIIDSGKVHFGQDETSVPCIKSYLTEKEYAAPYSVFYKDGRASTKRLRGLMEADVFQNPKDEEVVQSLIEFTLTKDSIVLDFFSGSATTAHAVFLQNAKDEGNRRFILVQLPEATDEKDNAYKAGYKNICEIGKERIRRAGEKIKAEVEEQNAQLKIGEEPKKAPDIGFKDFKLDTSNLKKWQPDYDEFEQSLWDSVGNYVDGRSELDVVYEIMLKMGLDLTWPLETHTYGGKNVYTIGLGALMICLDDHITPDVAEGMVSLHKELAPETWKVVFKDNGFADDSAKVNTKEILKCAGLEEDAFTTV
ncbi:hypothetical protein SDC9_103120 [bioreactor metagenome]|uniref:DNA methylase N-4/N-6 domain-containing protein n=1 Tax=bioreactor metagenome TaxID=1076179 RepID=A0A645AU79_9ZZZZ